MSTTLVPGANANLTGSGPYTVTVTHDSGPETDLTGFLLAANARVRSDDDMVFFNAPNGPGAQYLPKKLDGNKVVHQLIIDPARWPADVERVRIGLTVDDTTFGAVTNLEAFVTDSSGAVVATLDFGKLGAENAIIVGDIYRRSNTLKVRCEAAGFTNGLAGLATDVGVSVDDEPAQDAGLNAVQQAAADYVISLAKTPPPANASALDLRKHTLAVVLVKNKLTGKIFRVVLLIDSSGSMSWSPSPTGSGHIDLFAERGSGGGWLGSKGKKQPSIVQCSLERMVPVADLFDDNHEMELWFFGSCASRSESVSVDTMEGYIVRNWQKKLHAGGSNEEQLVMQEVIDWVKANPSEYPTLVLAWSDGGIYRTTEIEQLLVSSSPLPIFWMWLGLGSKANYTVLEKLDKIEGGVVDNCGFIKIDDIEQMTDEDLYGKIMAFVSKWCRDYDAAKAAGLIPA